MMDMVCFLTVALLQSHHNAMKLNFSECVIDIPKFAHAPTKMRDQPNILRINKNLNSTQGDVCDIAINCPDLRPMRSVDFPPASHRATSDGLSHHSDPVSSSTRRSILRK